MAAINPLSDRIAAHDVVSRALGALSDEELGGLLAGGRAMGSGIGGATVEVEVAGVRVFAKRIPVTELELRAENRLATGNLFGLPTFYQYPMGSAGFGAWREVAAHRLTTSWVLEGGSAAFPLTYHWRVLPGAAAAGAGIDGFEDVAEAVASWDGSAAVRRRLEAIGAAGSCVAVFMEHVPQRLGPWLCGPDADFERAEARLADGVAFMRSRGFVHFDAHFNNVLTDGDQVYFADFGLATCDDFALSAAERQFLDVHRDYDYAYVYAGLAARSIAAIRGERQNLEFLRAWIAGDVDRSLLPPDSAALVDRYAPLGALTLEFHRSLEDGGKAEKRWPRETVAALLRELGREPNG
ncbi:MAG TPA: hypothetical protein VL551_15645 [Actinospica sp.]|jgi:hypothetical protein|nr:hypothetical protein [Actinospica sp.]